MEKIITVLHDGNYSCVVENSNGIHTFSQRGVADLYNMVKNQPRFLNGASIADKVVGKGAATLMILGGIKELYADVISHPALALLQENGIEPEFETVVPFIENRDKSDWCPLEKICYEESSPDAILPLIEEFINRMRKLQNT
ncbi:DUF1893 domain-containing protein [Dysgonomonas macrotermitis]|uniref:DUF1893 domain-containing protein n=1 Tax=Dysgonomonas macrotermitis TaxID=1346286 RepID=A0A1M5GP72_9BACT|nr:DUF1893 domain-containing protein [Dysgonomonas macrotermitis]SHG05448.1 protein of unknown function [Dysgonomonas macrotermitis]